MADQSNDWIAVTGASGFIGRHLVDRLLSENRRVVVISRSRPVSPHLDRAVSAGQARLIMKAEPDTYDLRETSAIVMLAGLAHRSARKTPAAEYVEVNTNLSVRTAKAAIAAGCRRLVYVSTVAVHGDGPFSEPIDESAPIAPTTPYGRSKWQAEQALDGLCREAAVSLIRLRPPLVYSPDAPGSIAMLRKAIERHMPLPFASIQNRRHIVSVRDLAAALVQTASMSNCKSSVLLVANPTAVSTKEIADALASITMQKARFFSVSKPALTALFAMVGLRRLGLQLCEDYLITSTKICNEFGWRPSKAAL